MKNRNESIEGIALTLSNYFSTKPPSGANGKVLLEIIQQHNK